MAAPVAPAPVPQAMNPAAAVAAAATAAAAAGKPMTTQQMMIAMVQAMQAQHMQQMMMVMQQRGSQTMPQLAPEMQAQAASRVRVGGIHASVSIPLICLNYFVVRPESALSLFLHRCRCSDV